MKNFVVMFLIKMQMINGSLWAPEAREPAPAVRALVSVVNSGLSFSFVVLSDVSFVNVSVERIIADI